MKSSTNRALVAMNQSTSFAQVANKLFSTIASLRLLLVMFLTLCVSAAWGETINFTGSQLPSGWSGTGSFNSDNNHYHSATPGYALANGQYLQTAEYTNITSLTFWGSTSNGGNGKSLTIQYKEKGSNTWNDLSSIVLNKSAQVQKTVTVTSLAGKTVSLKFSTTWNTAYLDDIEIVTASAQSHTITAISNNTDYGTVSVSGTTITATPNDCYQVVSGIGVYTIESGTATVTHEGNSNTLTVNASTDCSIQVNFEKKPVNTYIDNVHNNESVELCGTHDMPSLSDKTAETEGTCEELHWHFMGWVTEANKENPTDANIVKANTSVTANATTYYAVWAKGETRGSGTTTTTFNAGVDNIATGKNGIKFTMSNTTGSNGYYQVYSGTKMEVNSENPISSFTITCTASGTSKYGPGNITFTTGNYSYSGYTGTWTGNATSIQSNNSTQQLRIETITVTTSGGTTTTYSDYTTQCATEPSLCLIQKEVAY